MNEKTVTLWSVPVDLVEALILSARDAARVMLREGNPASEVLSLISKVEEWEAALNEVEDDE